MRSILFFASDYKLQDADILRFLFPNKPSIQWAKDVNDAIPDQRLVGTCVNRGGDFPLHYTFYNAEPAVSLRQAVDNLLRLSTATKASFLTDHDGANPYLYVHITPSGMTEVVGVDVEKYAMDQLFIEGNYHEGLGIIGFESVLEEQMKASLARHFAPEYERMFIHDVQQDVLGPDFPGTYQGLSAFRHFYLLMPDGKAAWYSAAERSEKLVTAVRQWSNGFDMRICLFPPEVDSEDGVGQTCLVLKAGEIIPVRD